MTEPDAIAVIQAHFTDLLSGDTTPAHYCIEALRRSRRVARIVVAVPDLPENRVFGDLAACWNVDVFFGSELDVVGRLISAAAAAG
jgi:spore coat polysaccharide biosynthesis protein SpsF (cytidylyltransferase family)